MKITIHNQQRDLKIPVRSFKQGIAKFLEYKKVLCSSVIVHYVSKKKIIKLHDEFFDDPTPTDCISLPIDASDDAGSFSILGEIFVCPKVAVEYSAEHNSDPLEETLLYTIHGLLHLLGFNDLTGPDRKIMRREEGKAMIFLSKLKQ